MEYYAMPGKASFVLLVTLTLYLLALFTVSYVGVYLTCVAIPILILSGFAMKCATPKPEHKKNIDDAKTALRQVDELTSEAINSFLGGVNKSLSEYNEVNALVTERAKFYKDQVQQLKLEKIPFDVHLKYEKSQLEQNNIQKKIDEINKMIDVNEKQIEKIRYACELEVKVK